MSSARQLALVIGGGSGIGRATALRLAKERIVVVAGRSAGPLAETVTAIEAQGGEAYAEIADVRVVVELHRLIAAVTARGRLSVSVNAFGLAHRATPVDRLELASFEAILDVHYRGVFLAMQAEAVAMIPNGGGAIVNVASVLGSIGWAGQAAYSASKHATLGLAQVMAAELSGAGVRINTVCPGLVRSPMMQRLAPKSLKVPGPDLTHAPDVDAIAESIAWLASDAASAIVGQAIEVGANARRII